MKQELNEVLAKKSAAWTTSSDRSNAWRSVRYSRSGTSFLQNCACGASASSSRSKSTSPSSKIQRRGQKEGVSEARRKWYEQRLKNERECIRFDIERSFTQREFIVQSMENKNRDDSKRIDAKFHTQQIRLNELVRRTLWLWVIGCWALLKSA
jgi:hypothetical protein